jgi:hypothetical protein
MVYVDWFADSGSRLFRRHGAGHPWRWAWDDGHWSWVVPPTCDTARAVDKFFVDGARGTIIITTTPEEKSFLRLKSVASIIFKLPVCHATFLSPQSGFAEGTGRSDQCYAFIVDDVSQTVSTQDMFDLNLADEWNKFRWGRCPFNIQRWKKALEYYPSNAFVTDVLRGASWGVTYEYSGTRLASRECTNLRSEQQYADQLIAAREKQYTSGIRSGPFAVGPGKQLPLFNWMTSPTGGVVKTFSDKVRPINDFGFPYDDSAINECISEDKICNTKFKWAADVLARLGRNTLMFTIDVKGAFKLIPVALADKHLNGELHRDKRGNVWASFSSVLNFWCKICTETMGFIWTGD